MDRSMRSRQNHRRDGRRSKIRSSCRPPAHRRPAPRARVWAPAADRPLRRNQCKEQYKRQAQGRPRAHAMSSQPPASPPNAPRKKFPTKRVLSIARDARSRMSSDKAWSFGGAEWSFGGRKMTSDLSLINWQCGSSSGPASAPRSDRLAVEFRLESDHELAAAEVEHRPLDHRRLRQHQRHGLLGVEMVFVFLRKFTEAHAGAVEQRLPANFLAPSLQPLAFDPGGLVVVEGIVDAVLVQPSARL